MFNILLQWIIQPKNAILSGLLVLVLGLTVHDRYLSYKVDSKIEEIGILQGQIINLKNGIQIQNNSIKKMNEDYELQKTDFEKKYSELQVKNKVKIDSIKKNDNYVSPTSVITKIDEYEESMRLIKENDKERGVK